jgi:hypothetical protein
MPKGLSLSFINIEHMSNPKKGIRTEDANPAQSITKKQKIVVIFEFRNVECVHFLVLFKIKT